jgi:hypothetical protein
MIDERWHTVPVTVMSARGLSDGAVCAYAAIHSFSRADGFCVATNRAIGRVRNKSAASGSRWVRELAASGLVSIQNVPRRDGSIERRIYPTVSIPKGVRNPHVEETGAQGQGGAQDHVVEPTTAQLDTAQGGSQNCGAPMTRPSMGGYGKNGDITRGTIPPKITLNEAPTPVPVGEPTRTGVWTSRLQDGNGLRKAQGRSDREALERHLEQAFVDRLQQDYPQAKFDLSASADVIDLWLAMGPVDADLIARSVDGYVSTLVPERASRWKVFKIKWLLGARTRRRRRPSLASLGLSKAALSADHRQLDVLHLGTPDQRSAFLRPDWIKSAGPRYRYFGEPYDPSVIDDIKDAEGSSLEQPEYSPLYAATKALTALTPCVAKARRDQRIVLSNDELVLLLTKRALLTAGFPWTCDHLETVCGVGEDDAYELACASVMAMCDADERRAILVESRRHETPERPLAPGIEDYLTRLADGEDPTDDEAYDRSQENRIMGDRPP